MEKVQLHLECKPVCIMLLCQESKHGKIRLKKRLIALFVSRTSVLRIAATTTVLYFVNALLCPEACCCSPALVSQSFPSVQWWWVYPRQHRPPQAKPLNRNAAALGLAAHSLDKKEQIFQLHSSCTTSHLHVELCFHLLVRRKQTCSQSDLHFF